MLRTLHVALIALPMLLTSASVLAGPIEAVRGKRYLLTDRHGPWMIMVASFRDVPRTRVEVIDGRARRVRNEDYRSGKTAIDAADELVYELRAAGIPAYVYEQEAVLDQLATTDRMQRVRNRTYTAQTRNIAVLAGNYKTSKSRTATKTLEWVKRFQPRFLPAPDENGRLVSKPYRPTPGQPGPLTGAFLTTNPMLTPTEAKRKSGERDRLLLSLNSGDAFSLLDNRGRYTIVVATFYGNSKTVQFNADTEAASKRFKTTHALDSAAESARQMARYMRTKQTEAYVYHERHRSLVTVGSFDSPNDPRIARVIKFFSPKMQPDPQTGRMMPKYEFIVVPPPKRGGASVQLPIDPRPHVIPVPKV